MALLHTINSANPNIKMEMMSEFDCVLFWQDGVFCALTSSGVINQLMQKQIPMYALDIDVNARGLSESMASVINIISLEDVVELTESYFPQITHE